MPGEFDMEGAVSQVSEGLDLGLGDSGGGGGGSEQGGNPLANEGGEVNLENEGGEGLEQTQQTLETKPPEGETKPDQTGTALAPPRTWRQEAAALWAQVPPPVQAEIAKREEDIFKGIETYKAAAEFGAPLKQVLDPYLPILQQYGIKPEAQVQDMMSAHYTLAFGKPEEKVALVKKVIKDYGIDPAALFAGGQGDGGGAYVDPQVAGLQQELSEIKSRLSQNDRAAYEAERQRVTRHVEAFAADPKNLYFEELANDIVLLLRTKAEPTVEAAYQTAMWKNPAVRAKELARQAAEKAETEKKAAADKAVAARKATAANVRTQARSGSATAPLGSMDETLASTLANIHSRA